jgi:hypothetical protein
VRWNGTLYSNIGGAERYSILHSAKRRCAGLRGVRLCGRCKHCDTLRGAEMDRDG